MPSISRDDVLRTGRERHLEERLVIRVGRSLRERPSDNELSRGLDLVDQRSGGFGREAEPRTREDGTVLREDARIDAENDLAHGDEPHDLSGRPERRQEPGDEDVGVEDDPQRRRFLRTAAISASTTDARSPAGCTLADAA